MVRTTLGAILLMVTSYAFGSHADCNLYYSDDNGNGSGSVEGSCYLDIEFDTGRYGASPSLEIEVVGLNYSEQSTVFSDYELPVTSYSSVDSSPHFWDRNQNGSGTVQGRVRMRGADHWSSRSVAVYAYIDGRRFEIFHGRLPRY